VKLVTFEVNVKRLVNRRLVLATADAVTKADGEVIYEAEDLRVALFT
jgi:3-hydroxyacyl-[acyl-carrier protein] dehydratase/trans-2-decenoyl-[acyl-carrier protein] isomerase